MSAFIYYDLSDHHGEMRNDRPSVDAATVPHVTTIIKQIISVIAMRPVENSSESQRLLAHTVTRWLWADMVLWLMWPRCCTLQIAADRGCAARSMDAEKLSGCDLRGAHHRSRSVTTSGRSPGSSSTPVARTSPREQRPQRSAYLSRKVLTRRAFY